MSFSKTANFSDSTSLLGRCSLPTQAAVRRCQKNPRAEEISRVVDGVITHYVEESKLELMSVARDGLRLSEDLGLDSLSMIEIAMTLEEAFESRIDDGQLRDLRTLGDVKRFLQAQVPRLTLIDE